MMAYLKKYIITQLIKRSLCNLQKSGASRFCTTFHQITQKTFTQWKKGAPITKAYENNIMNFCFLNNRLYCCR